MGHVVFTFCDHDAEEFLTLGQSDNLSPDMLAAFYDALPAANDPDSPFLADLWSDRDCHEDDKPISALAIEVLLGESLDVLMQRARDENRRRQNMLSARYGKLRP